ncbi:MAG: hypothetical protein P9L88_02005 [Candidatus Tantalella remota]|nr:hypothetical protein [Candidatus Tantalella remota]
MKKLMAFMVVMALVIAFVAPAALAADKSPAEYTGNVVTSSVNTVGEAVKGTTETAVSPIVAFWRSLIGKGNPDKIVTDPVNTGGKTIKDATVNTGKTVAGQKVQ